MNPAPSRHAQIRDAAETYYREHGRYVEAHNEVAIVYALAARIDRPLAPHTFEEFLTAIHRREITLTGNGGIWDGAREIWPNAPEQDYTQARDQRAQHQDADITALIIALTGETP